MEVQLSYFSPKRWCCESVALNLSADLENSAVATGLGKVSFHSNAKECSNYHTIALFSHASKVMPKILQPRFMWTMNFQIFKLVLEKAENPEIQLPTFTGSSKKQENSRKTSIPALLTMPKPLNSWITINCGKFWKSWKYQTTWPASWETYMHVSKQQLELDMEKQTGSK